MPQRRLNRDQVEQFLVDEITGRIQIRQRQRLYQGQGDIALCDEPQTDRGLKECLVVFFGALLYPGGGFLVEDFS